MRGTTIGRSAASGAERPRLASIGVGVVFIVRGADSYARGSTGRGRGRRSSIVGLVHSETEVCVFCAPGVMSELKRRVVAVFCGASLGASYLVLC